MERHAVFCALVLAACVIGVTRADATKGGKNKNGGSFPEPVQRAMPCHIKSPKCVPTYTESGAQELARQGYLGQVAVVPDMPPSMLRDMGAHERPKHKRKATCRGEDGAECRRPQRKRGGERRKGGKADQGGEAAPRKGRKGRKKAQREGNSGSEQDPTKPQRPANGDQQSRKERKQRRKQRPVTPATPDSTPQ